ncbi:MAG: hypothetical protein ACRDF9_07220 [Candidatus Limnocylindria bacterium]
MLGSLARHVKWFIDSSRYPTDYSLLLTLPVIAAFAVGGLAVAAAAFVQRRVPEPRIFRALERFAWLGPLVLGVHVGPALIAAAALGMLFVPSLRVERDAFGFALLAVEAACGFLLLLGFATRAAAVALALLGVVAMQPFNFESILEQVHILGVAIFLFITGRGALSIDRVFRQQRALPVMEAPAVALTLLRVCMGVGIAFGALTEKLLDPALAGALLTERPYLNVLAGLGVADGQFVYLAGLVELVIGIVVVSGQLTRPAMAVGAVLFTMTLPVFGWLELLGHLPYYGIMLTLFIAPSADPRQVRTQLREGRRAA